MGADLVDRRRDHDLECAGRGQEAERAGDLQDLVGRLLHLPQPLEEGDGSRIILDADTEQRQGRYFEKFRQPADGVELDDLALLVAVERRARNTEARGDFLGPQAGFHPKRPKLVADLIKAHPPRSPRWPVSESKRVAML